MIHLNWGVRGMAIYLRKVLLCELLASFANEAKQILRNITHCSASHKTSFVHFCANLFAQKATVCAKTKSLGEN